MAGRGGLSADAGDGALREAGGGVGRVGFGVSGKIARRGPLPSRARPRGHPLRMPSRGSPNCWRESASNIRAAVAGGLKKRPHALPRHRSVAPGRIRCDGWWHRMPVAA